MQEDEEFFLKRHRQALVGMVAQLAELSAHDLADRAFESQRGESRRLLILRLTLGLTLGLSQKLDVC